jgi:predicted transcriptional regulator of viral defense system
MKKRRTRKLVSRKKKVVSLKDVADSDKQEIRWLRADLTKSLWLTMLAVGVEVALWYFLKP